MICLPDSDCPYCVCKSERYRCLALEGHEMCKADTYQLCTDYKQRHYIDSFKLPITCPLFSSEGEQKEEGNICHNCEVQYELSIYSDLDYRTCQIFSVWYWKQKGDRNEPRRT